jgi:hypothetical protein
VYVNNYDGRTGTVATIRIRAGSRVGTFSQVMDVPNRGSVRTPVAVVTCGSDGAFVIR